MKGQERAEALKRMSEHFQLSPAAADLLAKSGCIDLHMDTFIPPRLPFFRYNLRTKHEKGFLGGYFFGHLDFPRVLESGLSGGMWSLTTNPFRTGRSRWRVFKKNWRRFTHMIQEEPHFRLVDTAKAYREAKQAGQHAVMMAIQGGNALEKAPQGLASLAALPLGRLDSGYLALSRVTLLHMTHSGFGGTSSPLGFWRRKRGLTEKGRAMISELNAERVFLDLAHINKEGFWEAVDQHDKNQPLIVTHTGVSKVKPHWRNLDDEQILAVTKTGGVIGIIFAEIFLKRKGGPRDLDMVVEHIEHVMNLAGEDAVAIGTDYDGAILPPKDLRHHAAYLRLVDRLLKRGHSEEVITKILSENFLASFEKLRPTKT